MDNIERNLVEAIRCSEVLYSELLILSNEPELHKTFYAPVFNTILEGGKFIQTNLRIVYTRYAQRQAGKGNK